MGSYLSSSSITQPKVTGRVAIVTGANRGIGYHTAKQLYELGATVYLGCRTESNALKAIEQIQAEIPESSGQLKWFIADMSSVKQAKHSAESFLRIESQLDILVLNAGIGDRKFELNEDGIETTMATNHIGPFIFSKFLLETMKRTSSKPGSDVRIVTLTSRAYEFVEGREIKFMDEAELFHPFPSTNYDTWRGKLVRYGRSKLANILFTRELQRQLDAEGSNIITLSLHPGTIATGGTLDAMATIPFIGPLARIIASYLFMSEPNGARTTIFAATDPVVRAESEKYRGAYLRPYGKVTLPSKQAQDGELSKRLWALSEKIVEDRIKI